MSDLAVVNWDRMRSEIEQAKDIKVLTGMVDKLEAFRVWAKQSKLSLEVQNQIAEYRLRTERKIGSWLEENEATKDKGGRPSENQSLAVTGLWKLKDLDLSKNESSKAQLLNRLSDEQFESFLSEAKETAKEVTLAEAVRVAKQIVRGEKLEEQKEKIKAENLVLPEGLFDVIVIDPPWNYKTEYDPKTPFGRVSNPYPEMSQDELLNIKLPVKEDCILWLWTTNSFIKDAFELCEAWGFAPKTILTWDKVNIGVGYWLRNVTEHCILAVKGSPVWDNKSYSTILREVRTEHSVKPEGFYKMVDDLCVGRKLDYFARKKREGWSVYGDEV